MGQSYFDGFIWHNGKHIFAQHAGSEIVHKFRKTEIGYQAALQCFSGVAKVINDGKGGDPYIREFVRRNIP